MRPRLALALLLGLSACTEGTPGDSTDASSTGTTAPGTTGATTAPGTAPTTGEAPTTSGGSTGDTDAVCLEAHYTSDDAPAAWKLTCALPELCPGDGPLVFWLGAPELLTPETAEVDDLERARCMATALRERTIGQFSWIVIADSVVTYDPVSLEILGDGAIARSAWFPIELIDPAPKNTYEGLFALRSPDFFAACEGGDAMQLWLCLADPVVPTCLPGPLPCPD